MDDRSTLAATETRAAHSDPSVCANDGNGPPGRPSAGPSRKRQGSGSRRGLGLIELLTLVAVLMIGLALMVATARHVRATSATELTRKRMRALADAAVAAMERGIDPTSPVPSNVPGSPEDRLRAFARISSHRLDEAIATEPRVAAPALANAIVAAAAGRPELDDAWGQPIALMPGQQPALGMAPDDGPFLVSAGPDGRFLTLSDNIYSYDLPALLPKPKPEVKPELKPEVKSELKPEVPGH